VTGIASLGPGAINLRGLSTAMRKAPAAMWLAYADAADRAFRGWWRDHFKQNSKLKFGRGRYSLGNPKRWPFQITPTPPNPESVDWSKFSARVGNYDLEGKPSAAPLLEEGGTLRPKHGPYFAIVLGKGKKGGRGKSVHTRMKQGAQFVRILRNGKLYLHKLVKDATKRGRPRKGAPKPKLVPEAEPSFLLVKQTKHRPGLLGFERGWKAALPDTRRRMAENLRSAVKAVLAGKPVPIGRAARTGVPG
jgi:hypothetical protein